MNSTIRRASLGLLLGVATCLLQTLEAQTGPVLEARMYAGITLTGALNAAYAIQATTNLADPNGWKTLVNVVLTNSPWLFFDTNSPEMARRYYRAVGTNSNANAPVGMVWIAPGTFTMGSPASEADHLPDEVQHTVTISQGFWMGKYEVTQVKYLAVMGNNPSYNYNGNSTFPVEQVSWLNATNYCGKLTQQERAAGHLPTGYVYRLPTEAEWEYCCRAGTTTATAYGNSLSSTQANFDGNQPYGGAAAGPFLGRSTDVGSYAPNAWGLYDMHGNVWEWCWDWYGTYSGGSVTDPNGPASGSDRVIRGGGWENSGRSCRSALRYGWPGAENYGIGFRPVLAPGITNAPPDTNTPSGMALIPAGSFTMGDTLGDGFPDELPLHTVQVSAFYMDWTEVTKTFWDEVYNWAITHGYSFEYGAAGKAANHPAQSMTWYDAVKWCNARSEKEGRVPAYYTSASQTTAYRAGQVDVQNSWVKWAAGYRLPAEAEWEKAARCGLSGKRFPWGDTITHSQANYKSSSDYAYDISSTRGYHPSYQAGGEPYTSPVGSFAANGYGLYDMTGNVWELCWDWYGPYSSGSQTDPHGPAGSRRVIRGGSWRDDAWNCRVTDRNGLWPDSRNVMYGFRSVLPTGQ